MQTSPDPEAIRELAYALWEQRGRPQDSPDADWFAAERIIGARLAAAANAANASSNGANEPAAHIVPIEKPATHVLKTEASSQKSRARVDGRAARRRYVAAEEEACGEAVAP